MRTLSLLADLNDAIDAENRRAARKIALAILRESQTGTAADDARRAIRWATSELRRVSSRTAFGF
jgi:hypothetical protein